jgi:hypothetical protein
MLKSYELTKPELQELAEKDLKEANTLYKQKNYLDALVNYTCVKGYIEEGWCNFSSEVKAKIFYRRAICYKQKYPDKSPEAEIYGFYGENQELEDLKLAWSFGKNDFYTAFSIAVSIYSRVFYYKEDKSNYREALSFLALCKKKSPASPEIYLLEADIRFNMKMPISARIALFNLIEILDVQKLELNRDEIFLNICKNRMEFLDKMLYLFAHIDKTNDNPEINKKLEKILYFHLANLINAEEFQKAIAVFRLIEDKAKLSEFMNGQNLFVTLCYMIARNGLYEQVIKLAFFNKAFNPKASIDILRYTLNLMDEVDENFGDVLIKVMNQEDMEISESPIFYRALENFMDSNRVAVGKLSTLIRKNKEHENECRPKLEQSGWLHIRFPRAAGAL